MLPADVQVIRESETAKVLSDFIAGARKGLDLYLDPRHLHHLVRLFSANRSKIMSLKSNRQLRCLTEIKKENLLQCKELMKGFELFHSPSLTGTFLIVDDRTYLGFLDTEGTLERFLKTTDASFIGAQRFLVNFLFKKSIPAEQRIKEIGKGTESEFLETINDPAKVKALILELLRSALYEISILFSTRNSFLLAEKGDILEEIRNTSSMGVRVRMLVMHEDEVIKEISQTKLRLPETSVQVNYLQQLHPTKITTLIVDQTKTLTFEVNDDTQARLEDAVGLATYSNSESTVFSNASMFESLWLQSEIDRQDKAKQAYFRLFKGLKLKDEFYNRHWSDVKKEEKNKTKQ